MEKTALILSWSIHPWFITVLIIRFSMFLMEKRSSGIFSRFIAGLGGEGEKGAEAVISFIENYYKKVRDLRNFSLQYEVFLYV